MALVNYMGDSGSSLFSFSGINRGLFGSASQSGRGASTGSGSRSSQGQKYDKPDYEGYPGDASYMNHLDQQFQKAQRKGLSKYGNDLKFYYASPEYKEALRLQQNQVYNEKTAEENKEKGDIFMSTNKAKNTFGQFVLDKNASAGSYELYRGTENQGYISDKQSYVDGIRKSPNYDPETDALYPVYYDQQTSNMLEAGKWADEVYKGVKTHKQSGGGKRQDIQLNDYLETVTTTVDRTWSRMNNFEQIGHALESLWENIPEGARYALSQNFYNDAVNDNQIFDFKMKKATKEDVKNKRASEVGQLIHVVDKKTGGLAFENINPDEEMWSEIMNDPYELKRLQDAHAFKFLQKRKEMYPSTDNTDKTDITTNINAASGASRREDAAGGFWGLSGWSGGSKPDQVEHQRLVRDFSGRKAKQAKFNVVTKTSNPKQIEIANMSYAGKKLGEVVPTESLVNVDKDSPEFGQKQKYSDQFGLIVGKWQKLPPYVKTHGVIGEVISAGFIPDPLDSDKQIQGVQVAVILDEDDYGTIGSETLGEDNKIYILDEHGKDSPIGDDWFSPSALTNIDYGSPLAKNLGIVEDMHKDVVKELYPEGAAVANPMHYGNTRMILKMWIPASLKTMDLDSPYHTTSQKGAIVSEQVRASQNLESELSKRFNEQSGKLPEVNKMTEYFLGQPNK